MTWISRRTVSPTSGELVFTIDENAQLPKPQYWQQLWIICSGDHPTSQSSGESQKIQSPACRSFEVPRKFGSSTTQLSPAKYLESVSSGNVPSSVIEVEDIDPMSRCQVHNT